MLYKVVITALDAVVLYTKVGIVLKNIITNAQLSACLLQRELTQDARMDLLIEVIIPHIMLTKVLTHIEGWGRTMEESCCSELNSVTQERETKVSMTINMNLPCPTSSQPSLRTNIIMESLTECFQQLTTDRNVMLVPCLVTIIEGNSTPTWRYH